MTHRLISVSSKHFSGTGEIPYMATGCRDGELSDDTLLILANSEPEAREAFAEYLVCEDLPWEQDGISFAEWSDKEDNTGKLHIDIVCLFSTDETSAEEPN